MSISYEGIGQLCVTFNKDIDVRAGYPCKINRSSTVGTCNEDEEFIGIVESVRGSFASVILRGLVITHYAGTAPAVGYNHLTADGNGNVKLNSEGKEYLVIATNTGEKTVTFLL